MRKHVITILIIFFSAAVLFSSSMKISRNYRRSDDVSEHFNLNSPVFSKYLTERDNIIASELNLDIPKENKGFEYDNFSGDSRSPGNNIRDRTNCSHVRRPHIVLKCITEQSKDSEDTKGKSQEFSPEEIITRDKFDILVPKDVQFGIDTRTIKGYENVEFKHSFVANKTNGNKQITVKSLLYNSFYFDFNFFILETFEEKKVYRSCFKELFGTKTLPSNVVCDKYTCSFYAYEKTTWIEKFYENRDVKGLRDYAGNSYFLSAEYIDSIKKNLFEKAIMKYEGFSIQNQNKIKKIIQEIKDESLKTIEMISNSPAKINSDVLKHFKTYFKIMFNFFEILKSKPVIAWQDDQNFESMMMNLYDSIKSICEKLLTENQSSERRVYLIYECCPNKAIEEVQKIINNPLMEPVLTPGLSTIKQCEKNYDT